LPVDHKYVKKLLPALDILQKNRQLIRLKTDLPDTLNTPMPPKRREPDWKLIREICEDNSFKSIIKDIPVQAVETAVPEDFGELFAFAATVSEKEDTASKTEKKEFQDELF
jgi:hypothetical protein